MPRQEVLEKTRVSDRMFLFQPCVGSNKYPGLITASIEFFSKLGIELVTSDDQTCCGGFLTFTNVAQPTSTMPAVARNIAVAEEMGLDILTLCNGCHTFLTEFSHFMNDRPPVKNVVNVILSMIGREYKGSQDIYHSLEIIYKVKEKIRKNVTRPLSGMKFATHYGCHYLNGFKKTALDDPHMPTIMEELIEVMGGGITEYGENRTCCGTGLTQIIINKEALSLPHTKMKLDNLNAAEPDAVVVVCPYCLAQIDRMQQKLNYRGSGKYKVPVIHLVQLIGLALGVDIVKLGFDAHTISFENFLKKFDSIQAKAEVHNG
jgi:heterodisulfide reductase subunit B